MSDYYWAEGGWMCKTCSEFKTRCECLHNLRESIIEHRKLEDPLIDDVLETLDWEVHIREMCKKPWIDCRDVDGNLYTLYVVEEDANACDVYVIDKDRLRFLERRNLNNKIKKMKCA